MSFDSVEYWRKRYATGGNSGAGSYGALADFKADSLNAFIADNHIETAIEFGSGDGNQLKSIKVARYIGLDVSPTTIENTKVMYASDPSKSFHVYDPDSFKVDQSLISDIAISMDVILHLTEDERYEAYLRNLVDCSRKFLGVFNTATEQQLPKMASHNRFRDHRIWLEENAQEFEEVRVDILPTELNYPVGTGFYYYQRK